MKNVFICNTEIHQANGLYNLNDLHRASGHKASHKPSNFLRLSNTKELIQEIHNETKYSDLSILDNYLDFKDNSAVKVIGGRRGGTYACKELVYAYAMWISAKFNLIVIRAFDNGLQYQPQTAIPSLPATTGCKLKILTVVDNGIVTSTTLLGDDIMIIDKAAFSNSLDNIATTANAAANIASEAKFKLLSA